MSDIFKFLPVLINSESKISFNWFNFDFFINLQLINQLLNNNYNLNIASLEPENRLFLDNIFLIVEELWEKIQDGLTLNDIENSIIFILSIRFIILSLRYNLKTSFYITCIGLFAGYLWYRHLIDLIFMYRSILLKLPFLYKLGLDAVQLNSFNEEILGTNLKFKENVNWYNLGQVFSSAFKNGIINVDPETGLQYYIDPISMIIANLQGSFKSNVLPMYYKIYNNFIPKIFDVCSKFWAQLSGVAIYAIITRIGKRYCPYLIRWHWTFLLIIGMVEQIFISFIYRASYFQTFILIPQAIESNINLQLNSLNVIIAAVVLTHVGLIICGLFHAIWGQYFYIPFFVENTEIHIGKRPTNSLYSGGQTAWQDPNEKNRNRLIPKLWYGWFGRGTQNGLLFSDDFKKFVKKILKKLKKQFIK